MGKLKDLFYKITRGSGEPKPNDFGPTKKLNLAALQEKYPVKIEVVSATVGTNPGCACGGSCACGSGKKTVTDAELLAHLTEEGLTAKPKPKKVSAAEKEATAAAKKAATPDAYVAEVKKQAVKKAPSKSVEKRVAIQKDAADAPVVAKKPATKKPAAKPAAKKPAPKKK